MSVTLTSLLNSAFDVRADLLSRLHAEGTDTYRLFHGTVEGKPGLTVDRYGDLLLVQTFHQSLAAEELSSLQNYYIKEFPNHSLSYNDRSQGNSRIANELPPEQMQAALQPREVHELGVTYLVQARHRGQDPWLFLDLRAARRRVIHDSPGKSASRSAARTPA
jgi:23S rRNA (cytosine1962-C5)-methyltransferase